MRLLAVLIAVLAATLLGGCYGAYGYGYPDYYYGSTYPSFGYGIGYAQYGHGHHHGGHHHGGHHHGHHG